MVDLIRASANGDEQGVRRLLAAGIDPNATDRYGETPLHFVALYGHETIARLLLAAGANPNAADQDGSTPLYLAASNGREATVPLLLAAGANPNTASRSGWTPLHAAAHYSRRAMVPLLLAAGANPTLRNKDGETPARVARTVGLQVLLTDAEYVWAHTWNPEEHSRWTEAQRLERVGALSAFRTQTGRRIVIPELPRELQFAVFEHL